jgi:hypothetical protein
MPKHAIGFVYVMTNDAMPGLVKVGMTTNLSEDRARDLQRTGVPLPFNVEFRAATSMPKAVEAEAHRALAPLRVSANREFFNTSHHFAKAAIRDALLNVAGLDAWCGYDEQQFIKNGDRIALTLEAGDLFVVLTYPNLFGSTAVPIDVWQAHSDGDLLELMGTCDPGHVAGTSDGDVSGEVDPVPHLNRTGDAPNGSIVGRERLMPGDRLIWLRPLADRLACKIVMFECTDYCQAVGRSWDAKVTREGGPLLLTTPTLDELPPGVVRATQAAMRMTRPRSWVPRSPEHLADWASAANRPQPPEYWLRQLGRR